MDAVVTRLLEIGCFETPNKSHYQAVLDADSRQAIKIISLKNAGA